MVGAICDFVDAIDDSRLAVARLASSTTHIVSLTVTAKGYSLLPDGRLNLHDPDIVHDIQYPERPRSAIGLIVAGLNVRFQQKQPPFTVMSCDSLQQNGHQARNAVCAVARATSPELADWIAQQVCFPVSMVERITPAPDPAISQKIRMENNLADEALLLCEPPMHWVIEDRFNNGRPAWEQAGAKFSNEVHRFEQLSIGLLNGSQSAIAHLGLLLDYDKVHELCQNPQAETWLREYMAEVLSVVSPPSGVNGNEYCANIVRRFQNSGIVDRLQRLAEDSSNKFCQCVFPALGKRLLRGLDSPRLCQAIAIWFYYLVQLNDPDYAKDRRHYANRRFSELTSEARSLCHNDGVSHQQLSVMLKSLVTWPDAQISIAATKIQTEMQSICQASSFTAWWQQH